MNWFNYVGLIIIFSIMVPNIIYGIKLNGQLKTYSNKAVNALEQIGRFGCICFMIFNVPFTYFNFWFNSAFLVYLIINGVLVMSYVLIWILCFNKNSLFKVLSLSIIPSVVFLFSGIMLLNILLMVFATIFAPSHIFISLKSYYQKDTKQI